MFTLKSNQKPKKIVPAFENPVETWRDFAGGFGKTVREESKNLASDTLNQLLALEKDVQKLSGELEAGQSLDVASMEQSRDEKKAAQEMLHTQPGIDYHREFSSVRETHVVREDTRHVAVRIEQILVELKNLANSSQELAVQFEEVTMETMPQEAGTYHLNFFEWVFAVVTKARERIEESQTWLSLFKSKKAQKGYWNMFKKHGTSFGLSNERVVATQTG